jgi:hypothetical protein
MALDPSLLRDALARTVRPVSAEQAVAEFGGGARGRSALAQELAGTSDKKSRAYKTAMRNLQRYAASQGKQRRTMGAKLRPRITRAVQIKRAAARLKGPITVKWIAPTLVVSADPERSRPDFSVTLSDEQLDDVREHLASGDDQEAIDVLAAESMAVYLEDEIPIGEITSALRIEITRG